MVMRVSISVSIFPRSTSLAESGFASLLMFSCIEQNVLEVEHLMWICYDYFPTHDLLCGIEPSVRKYI
jgi:hypothetical protein